MSPSPSCRLPRTLTPSVLAWPRFHFCMRSFPSPPPTSTMLPLPPCPYWATHQVPPVPVCPDPGIVNAQTVTFVMIVVVELIAGSGERISARASPRKLCSPHPLDLQILCDNCSLHHEGSRSLVCGFGKRSDSPELYYFDSAFTECPQCHRGQSAEPVHYSDPRYFH